MGGDALDYSQDNECCRGKKGAKSPTALPKTATVRRGYSRYAVSLVKGILGGLVSDSTSTQLRLGDTPQERLRQRSAFSGSD